MKRPARKEIHAEITKDMVGQPSPCQSELPCYTDTELKEMFKGCFSDEYLGFMEKKYCDDITEIMYMAFCHGVIREYNNLTG